MVTINVSKRGIVFLQITLLVFPLLLEVFQRCCFFLQVYKLEPLFLESTLGGVPLGSEAVYQRVRIWNSGKSFLEQKVLSTSPSTRIWPNSLATRSFKRFKLASWRVYCNTRYHCTPVLTPSRTKKLLSTSPSPSLIA